MAYFVSESTIFLDLVAKDNNGDIIDLTGVLSITFTLRQKPDSAAVLITKTLGSGVTVTDATVGAHRVTLDPADTLDFNGNYVFETKIIDASSNVSFGRDVKGKPLTMLFDENFTN